MNVRARHGVAVFSLSLAIWAATAISQTTVRRAAFRLHASIRHRTPATSRATFRNVVVGIRWLRISLRLIAVHNRVVDVVDRVAFREGITRELTAALKLALPKLLLNVACEVIVRRS